MPDHDYRKTPHLNPKLIAARRYPWRRVVSRMLFQGKSQPFGQGHFELTLECGHMLEERGCKRSEMKRCKKCWKLEKDRQRHKERYRMLRKGYAG